MFPSTKCTLPYWIDLAQEQFRAKWMCVADTTTASLDVIIRNADWHLMWLEGPYTHLGAGRTAGSAIGKARPLVLNRVKERINASELDLINAEKYPGFLVAKVTLHALHISNRLRLAISTN
jgi:hypothetical protein